MYAYDDRIIIFYNVRGGKQISCIGPGTGEDEETAENKKKANPKMGFAF